MVCKCLFTSGANGVGGVWLLANKLLGYFDIGDFLQGADMTCQVAIRHLKHFFQGREIHLLIDHQN